MDAMAPVNATCPTLRKLRCAPRFADRAAPLAFCLTVGLTVGLTACKDGGTKSGDDGGDEEAASTPVEPTAAPTAAADDGPKTPSGRMLAWLDPEARGAAFVRLSPNLDPALVATVFALPPAAADLLEEAGEVRTALDAIAPIDGPGPETWLGKETLVMQPALSSDTYLVVPITKPRAEVQAWLLDTGMQSRTVEGFDLLLPTNALPYKVAFLTDDLLGFIPVGEIGNGLGPLTAGRDLPPSDLRKQLAQAVEGIAGTVVELMIYGPLLHLDLDQDVHAARLAIRDWQGGGLDGQLMFQVSRDGAKAQKDLEARKTPLETDAVQDLVERVAFTSQGPRVEGRLQIPGEDLASLRGNRP